MKHVLVVDDNGESSALVCRMLKMSGYGTICCVGGVAALEHLRNDTDSIGLVITDWAMPKVDGLEVCRIALGLGIPSIILTAHNRPGDREEVQASGAVAHLIKPVTRAEIVRLVEQHILPGR